MCEFLGKLNRIIDVSFDYADKIMPGEKIDFFPGKFIDLSPGHTSVICFFPLTTDLRGLLQFGIVGLGKTKPSGIC